MHTSKILNPETDLSVKSFAGQNDRFINGRTTTSGNRSGQMSHATVSSDRARNNVGGRPHMDLHERVASPAPVNTTLRKDFPVMYRTTQTDISSNIPRANCSDQKRAESAKATTLTPIPRTKTGPLSRLQKKCSRSPHVSSAQGQKTRGQKSPDAHGRRQQEESGTTRGKASREIALAAEEEKSKRGVKAKAKVEAEEGRGKEDQDWEWGGPGRYLT
ncbi:hypothetical protein F5Y12DRAFT_714239 [Xylaria sp. FL1777]|nr:hypothetical protein F5Y12DRAFT_714239 [Xylaria sp. FL1777]